MCTRVHVHVHVHVNVNVNVNVYVYVHAHAYVCELFVLKAHELTSHSRAASSKAQLRNRPSSDRLDHNNRRLKVRRTHKYKGIERQN